MATDEMNGANVKPPCNASTSQSVSIPKSKPKPPLPPILMLMLKQQQYISASLQVLKNKF